ncbi:MAG: hypothetical protein ACOCQR_03875 [bacterium]
MGTGIHFIRNIADDIFDSDFILDKIAVGISGVTKKEFIKRYEEMFGFEEDKPKPIYISPGTYYYPPK